METKELNVPVVAPSKLHELMACPIEKAKERKTRIPQESQAHTAAIHERCINLNTACLMSTLGVLNLSLFYLLLIITT